MLAKPFLPTVCPFKILDILTKKTCVFLLHLTFVYKMVSGLSFESHSSLQNILFQLYPDGYVIHVIMVVRGV